MDNQLLRLSRFFEFSIYEFRESPLSLQDKFLACFEMPHFVCLPVSNISVVTLSFVFSVYVLNCISVCNYQLSFPNFVYA